MYKEPLEKIACGLTHDEVVTIFSNIDMLATLNEELYAGLLKEMEKDVDERMFGEVFLKKSGFFNAYKPYCINFEHSEELLFKLKEKEGMFTKFLDMAMADPMAKGLPLNAWLIKPVQRIMKYPLMLKELIKQMPPDHPDTASLNKALDAVMVVVNEINELKRHQENQDKIASIQMSFLNFFWGDELQLLQPQRKFVLEGKYKRGIKGTCYFYLFNDCMVAGRMVRKKNFMVNKAVKLKDIVAIKESREKTLKLLLVLRDKEKMHMTFETEKEKIRFLTELMSYRAQWLRRGQDDEKLKYRASIALWAK